MKPLSRALGALSAFALTPRAMALTFAAMSVLSVSGQAAAQASYQITFKNVTSNASTTGGAINQTGQALSPPVFVTHSSAYNLYTFGAAAPETIWRIAEGGDRSFLLNEVNGLVGGSVLSVAAPLTSPLPQQQSVSVVVQTDASHQYLSFASMLGWTNDGFVALRSLDLSTITSPLTSSLFGFDAGSEKNSEATGFLGALGGGNARDLEGGVITNHPGILGIAQAPTAWNWLPGAAATLTITPVPEPSSYALLLLGGVPLLLAVRRRQGATSA
jgi:hypothetical protein